MRHTMFFVIAVRVAVVRMAMHPFVVLPISVAVPVSIAVPTDRHAYIDRHQM